MNKISKQISYTNVDEVDEILASQTDLGLVDGENVDSQSLVVGRLASVDDRVFQRQHREVLGTLCRLSATRSYELCQHSSHSSDGQLTKIIILVYILAADRAKLESFVSRCKRLAYCSSEVPTYSDLTDEADDTLFIANHGRVLQPLLPDRHSIPYSLREENDRIIRHY